MSSEKQSMKHRHFISALVITAMALSIFSFSGIGDDYSVQAASKKVKVTYKANGGKFTAKKYADKKSYSKKIKKGKKHGKLPKVKRSGYTFKGWYTKKKGGKKVTKSTKIKKKTTLYARWAKQPVAKVESITSNVYFTYLPNGGANYATVNWTITLANVPKNAAPLNIVETTSTNDYLYGNSNLYPQYFNKVNSTKPAQKTLIISRKVYCVRMGGNANNASYSISVNGTVRNLALPWRACGIIHDGKSFITQ